MRFEKNQKYNTIAVYVIICAVIIAAFTSMCVYFSSVSAALGKLLIIMKPIIYGGIMAFLFVPIFEFSLKAIDWFCGTAAIIKVKLSGGEKKSAADVTLGNTDSEAVKPAPSDFKAADSGDSVSEDSGGIEKTRARAVRGSAKFIKLGITAKKKKKRDPKKIRKNIAILITYIIVALIIAAFIAIIVPQAMASYNDFSQNASGYIAMAEKFLENYADKLPLDGLLIGDVHSSVPFDKSMLCPVPAEPLNTVQALMNSPLHRISAEINSAGTRVDVYELLSRLLSNSYRIMDSIIPHIIEFLTNLVTELKNIFMGLIISIYLLSSRHKLYAKINKLVHSVFPEKVCRKTLRISKLAYTTFSETINGKILDSMVIGILCFIGMTVLRLPYAPFISLLVGITNMIPFLGPFLGGIPGALILFVVKPVYTIWFVILILLLQQLDMNLIEPKIVGNRTGLPSLIIISAVLIMGGAFGIVGMFIAVPVFGIIYVLLREWINDRLAEKNYPVSTESYIYSEPDRETKEPDGEDTDK